MDQSKGLTRTLRVLRETALVQLSQSATAAYMLLVREADLLSTFNIVWDMSHGFIRDMPKSTMNCLIVWVPCN